MKINERFIWALTTLNHKPTDHLLEIGCGSGILAELIAARLTRGKITAIDQSAAAIRMAVKRNERFINSGHSDFIQENFAKTKLSPQHYNKVLSFNLNIFWKDPRKELQLIRDYLVPDSGLFYLFHQAPYDISIAAADPLKAMLNQHSFEIVNVIFGKLHPLSAICIIAKPLSRQSH